MAAPLTEEQKQQWKDKIQTQKQSGLSIEKWCQKNQVVSSRFYYWRNKLFPNEVTPRCSNFIELKESKQCKLSLEYQHVHLQLESTDLTRISHKALEKFGASVFRDSKELFWKWLQPFPARSP